MATTPRHKEHTMRTRSLIAGLVAGLTLSTAAVAGIAEPAHAAAKPKLDQYGHGTWTTDGAGATLAGESVGNPFGGDLTGWIGPDDGTDPAWGGCEPGSGELTTTSADGKSLSVRLWGSICTAVAPAGRLTFKGWYTVVHFDGKGNRVADGVGAADAQTFADGTSQWSTWGDLY
jgi:hypothetical protein